MIRELWSVSRVFLCIGLGLYLFLSVLAFVVGPSGLEPWQVPDPTWDYHE